MNKQLIEQALGGRVATCESCGKIFINYESYRSPAKRCAACNDIRQGNESIALERECIAFYPAVTIEDNFPCEGWQSIATPDGIRFKLDRRGVFGQIVIWTKTPVEPGDVVNIRHMRATHQRANDGVEETHIYYVLMHTNETPSVELLVWDRSEEYPLRIRHATQPDAKMEYLGPTTLAKLALPADDYSLDEMDEYLPA